MQATESSGGNEQVPKVAGHHVQERSKQLQAENQQTQFCEGTFRVVVRLKCLLGADDDSTCCSHS